MMLRRALSWLRRPRRREEIILPGPPSPRVRIVVLPHPPADPHAPSLAELATGIDISDCVTRTEPAPRFRRGIGYGLLLVTPFWAVVAAGLWWWLS